MKKITELTEIKWRTSHYPDEYGRLVKNTDEYLGWRKVKTAGAGLRAVNLLVDVFAYRIGISMLAIALQFLIIGVGFTEHLTNLLLILAGIAVIAGYLGIYILCEYKWQRTLGKLLTKTVVIDEYGNRPELRVIILRTVIRIVPLDFFSFMYEPYRGWHDRWADTWVVKDEELAEIKRLQQEQADTNHNTEVVS